MRFEQRRNRQREASPSGGYEYVFSEHDCADPNCHETTISEYDPEKTTLVCGNHTLDEFEAEAEVKVRA